MDSSSRPFIGPLDIANFTLDEPLLDMQSAHLIKNIRESLAIHAEMFNRILDSTTSPSPLLAALLEDTGNRYLDFSELVSLACLRSAKN